MSTRFDELAAQRDPLYAAMQPAGMMEIAIELDAKAAYHRSIGEEHYAIISEWAIPKALLTLAVCALRNETL